MDKYSTVNPQQMLLLLCARTEESFENNLIREKQIQEASSRCLDWNHLLELAQSNSVTPLVYLTLSQICPKTIPQQALMRLKETFIGTAWLNLELTAELIRVLSFCTSHDIIAIPYKGPILASSVYGDLSYREFTDLDILVRYEDRDTLKELLLDNGYKSTINFNQNLEKLYFQSKCEQIFFHKEKGTCVEVHWTPVPGYFANLGDLSSFFARVETLTVGPSTLSTFRAEDLLVVLSVHGARHLWHQLKWICDIDRLIRANPDIDWGEVITMVKRCNISRMLYTGLYLTSWLLYTPIPEKVWSNSHKDPEAKRLATVFESQLFHASKWYGESLWTNRVRTELLERKCDKFRYLAGMAFRLSEDDVTWIRIPRICYPMYKALRPFNLIRRCSQTAFKRFMSST